MNILTSKLINTSQLVFRNYTKSGAQISNIFFTIEGESLTQNAFMNMIFFIKFVTSVLILPFLSGKDLDMW